MGRKIRQLKDIRIHSEGTTTLFYGLFIIVAVAVALWRLIDTKWPFWIFVIIAGVLYAAVLNFFRCPRRRFPGMESEGIVVAPADGKVVVLEEVDEKQYFHDRRLMISIFMSPLNVHANWFPVEGRVLQVQHHKGNYHKAWLPKASEENEHADILIEAADGHTVLCRQIAGAVARRIVTYAKEGEDCYIDDHMGFIKFGSRVDVFLPAGSTPCVRMGQTTTGDMTVIAKMPKIKREEKEESLFE